MQTIPMDQVAALVSRQLPKGIFLSVGGETPNVMTIGWGGLSFYWQRDVFTVPVRPQRHTYPLLKKAGAFTLSIPQVGTMHRELGKAGTLSGRDGDKFVAIGLSIQEGQKVAAPIIDGCACYLECVVRAEADFTGARTDPSITNYTYKAGDYHTLFFGEIVACYTGDAK